LLQSSPHEQSFDFLGFDFDFLGGFEFDFEEGGSHFGAARFTTQPIIAHRQPTESGCLPLLSGLCERRKELLAFKRKRKRRFGKWSKKGRGTLAGLWFLCTGRTPRVWEALIFIDHLKRVGGGGTFLFFSKSLFSFFSFFAFLPL
jgi:hypothetical protein